MKNILLLSISLLAFSGSYSAFADRPLHCKSLDGKTVVNVNLESVLRAQLLIDGVVPQFGNLSCENTQANSGTKYISCRSTGVADAGYHAYVFEGQTSRVVDLKEISIAGERDLAVLNCDY